jgi:hypothetical protein
LIITLIYIFELDEPFLRYDPKNSTSPDYTGVSENDKNSFLIINLYFQASSPFTIGWLFNKEKLTIGDQDRAEVGTAASAAAAAAAAIHSPQSAAVQGSGSSVPSKYSSHCTHYSVFNYSCFLMIDYYGTKDAGEYTAIVRLKDHKETSIKLSTVVIMPSK